MRPVQQIEIEKIRAETVQTGLTSARDSVSRHMARIYLRHQEYMVALARNHAADQFFRAAVAVGLGRVDQHHLKRKSRAQCSFFFGYRVSALRQPSGSLAHCWGDDAVCKFYRTL